MGAPKVNEETVQEIVDIASQKCFDWAQTCIPETMAAVAGELARAAVTIKHEIDRAEANREKTT